jgi:transposase
VNVGGRDLDRSHQPAGFIRRSMRLVAVDRLLAAMPGPTCHGTTTLFAALDVLEGTVLGRCMQRHRHQEFIRFRNAIEAAVPAGRIVHVILDNYATHKHPKVLAWLSRHPRFVFHFTPTACSWLNAVETFFAALTKRRLKRRVFRSIMDLQTAIHRYITEHNTGPKPFVWTADPERVLAAINRGKQALESAHYAAIASAP